MSLSVRALNTNLGNLNTDKVDKEYTYLGTITATGNENGVATYQEMRDKYTEILAYCHNTNNSSVLTLHVSMEKLLTGCILTSGYYFSQADNGSFILRYANAHIFTDAVYNGGSPVEFSIDVYAR